VNEIRRDWPDLEWTAVLDEIIRGYGGEVCRLRFAVYEHVGVSGDGTILFRKGFEGASRDLLQLVEATGDAQIALHGEIRFDGNSSWWIDTAEGQIFLQTGGRKSLEDFGEMMARCWDWAAEYLGEGAAWPNNKPRGN